MNATGYFRPISTWSGRLILPAREERREDGGVFIQMENVPDSHRSLMGKKAWLTWKGSTPLARNIELETVDVVFSAEALKSRDNGNIHPDRINGWRRVSPLESLAGIRAEDNVQVQLGDVTAVYTAGSALIQIGKEPVQIAGEVVGLAQFVEPGTPEQGGYLVRHYNSRSGLFDGPTEWIGVAPSPVLRKPPVPASSLEGIHGSELNREGWYLYGSMRNGIFHLKALEPRRLFQLKPTGHRDTLRDAISFIGGECWDKMRRGGYDIVLLDPGTKHDAVEGVNLKEGDSGLVAHLFGWIGGPRGERPGRFGMVSGHSSYGFAAVRKDRFTGDLRWEIEYRQVYCHNPEGIAAGAQAWHCYMGSLTRGWMYLPPVIDSIILHPCLNFSYRFGTLAFNPLEEIEAELFRITSRMRSGGGTGLSPVTMAESCAQDSTMAFNSLWSRIRERCLSNRNVLRWTRKNRGAPQSINFAAFMKIVKSWDSRFRPLRMIPPRWRRYRDMKPYRRLAGSIGVFLDGLLSFRSIFPRSVHDTACRIMLKGGARIWSIRSDGIGGVIDGIEPLWPTDFRRRHRPERQDVIR